jgi:redox-sensitive bicupin YhaK (pirin superfamily)
MTQTTSALSEQLQGDFAIIPATSFHRLTEREFGQPGLIAIESVGPFVELMSLGPFITIHDSFLEPGLGIDHHPHRGNERLFYILRGEIRHDDALNGIQGVMNEGDLARLTEGERGMLHREWNGLDDVTTHAFILVYTPDVEPPIPLASFDAHRAGQLPRVEEAPGVETLHVLGGEASFRANLSTLTQLFDSSLTDAAALDLTIPPNQGLILYPLDGALRLEVDDREPAILHGSSDVHPQGPDGVAIAWSDSGERNLRLSAEGGPARVIRIGFERGTDDVVLHQPWQR